MVVFCLDDMLSPSVDSLSTSTNQNPCKFKKGSKVQCGCPVEYGVIKWIGMFPSENKWLYAGVEMVSLLHVSSENVCVCVYLCVCMLAYICVCASVYMCVCVLLCTCVCVFVHVYVFMHVEVCECVFT